MTSSSASPCEQPAVTVMVVSDYRPGEQKSWNDLRATLAALATQDFDEPVEYLLLENRSDLKQMPEDVPQTLPGVRMMVSDARGSYELKNAGVQAATGDLVMVLDADCIPDRCWVRAGVDAMREQPDALAISGRTTYPGRSTLERSLGLLSRSYVDREKQARFVCSRRTT
jgi:cellulose synthase/poly-beta-1,6-N-acetylglucosamine synthase-like glycosyltransferase